MGSGNNLQGGGSNSFRSDRGSHNTQTRMQFTTNMQNQDMRLTESGNSWKSKRKQDFINTKLDENKTAESTTTPVVNGHIDAPVQNSQNLTDVNSSSFGSHNTGDLSKVDYDKVKDFVPEKSAKGVEPILAAKPSIDLDTDVSAASDRKQHGKSKEPACDRKMEFANRPPDDKSAQDNQGEETYALQFCFFALHVPFYTKNSHHTTKGSN